MQRERWRCGVLPSWIMGIVLGLSSLSVVAQASPERMTLAHVQVQAGDDPAWADPAFDDRDWPEVALHEVEPAGPIFWLRGRITIDPELLASGRPIGARFLALASCQLFWDGAWLGDNGTVGTSASTERPGAIDWLVPLPASVEPGVHTVALRCSAHRRGFEPMTGFYVFWIGDYLSLADAGRWHATQTLLSAGGLWAIGLFYVLTFALARRSRSHLWLGLLACASGALVIVESLRALVGYTYDLHIWRLSLITALAWAINALLLAFVTGRYPLSGRRRFLLVTHGILLASLALPSYDAKSAGLFLVGLSASFGWTVRAVRRGWSDAGYAIAGLALCLLVGVWQQQAFLDYFLFFTLSLLCLFLLVSHILADGRERREHAATELRSARLEIELLRRHLQPHFLMNTLTALAEWFEEEPEVASAMVEDLGRELRILADVSKQSSIPLGQELALCRSHLAVMARRRDEVLGLDAEGVDETASIPPAVFHTLLENALTHNAYRGEPASFRLREDRRDGTRVLTFDAPHRPRAGTDDPSTVREGTGLRYVRARLRESYGDRFTFDDGPTTAADSRPVWRTVIRLPLESGGAT
ncbi:MAG: histidine kinase [Acidobacteriota bacterium]